MLKKKTKTQKELWTNSKLLNNGYKAFIQNQQKNVWQMFKVNYKDMVVNSIDSHLEAYVRLLVFTQLEPNNILNLFQ